MKTRKMRHTGDIDARLPSVEQLTADARTGRLIDRIEDYLPGDLYHATPRQALRSAEKNGRAKPSHPSTDSGSTQPAATTLTRSTGTPNAASAARRAVILTALPVEYNAVRDHLTDPQEKTHPQGTVYEWGTFTAPSGRWEVAVAEIGAGNPGAAIEGERAIKEFHPRVVLFVGVAGGLKDVQLGDVVVATKVYGYHSGKAGETFAPRPDVPTSSYALVQRARAEARKSDWRGRLGVCPPDPAPRVFVKPIAAGEEVVASTGSDTSRRLKVLYSDALAVEMEGHGFLTAAQANQQVLALIVRGISDLIEEKSETDKQGWQETAARHASAFAFEILAKFDEETQQGGAPARRHNLPAQLTSFVGRESELREIKRLLTSQDLPRLVTLIGAPGIGKTRLAHQTAEGVLDNFSDGVYVVSLLGLQDPELVVVEIAHTLGVLEATGRSVLDALKEYLRQRCLLLVVDNFEHLAPAGAVVTDLLKACPKLKVLVTSRAALQVTGEHQVVVPPLALPDVTHPPSAERLVGYGAIRLFTERACDADARFAVTDENAAIVAEICQRLEGLPLAIELAAAWIRVLPLQTLLNQLSRRLTLLTGGAQDGPVHHQTLRQAIAWSYDLLTAEQQDLFRRLSVFAGGSSLVAVQEVCGAELGEHVDVLQGLASLVGKSLLQRQDAASGGARYTMLETIREYGLERLEERGEAEDLGNRHAGFYLATAQRAKPALFGPQQEGLWPHLEQEHNNLRSALDWFVARSDGERSLRLAEALSAFWSRRGYLTEGRRRLSAVLQLPNASARTTPRADALLGAGGLAYQQDDFAAAHGLFEEALAVWRTVGDKEGIEAALGNLANVATLLGDHAAAQALYQESLALGREIGHARGVAQSLQNLVLLATYEASIPSDARESLTEARAIYMRDSATRPGLPQSSRYSPSWPC